MIAEEGNPTGRHRFWFWLIVGCVVGIAGLNLYRAATQSITHDEARTYERYVRAPFYQVVFATDANNHIINTLLARFCVGIFGVRELSMRFPSVVAGTCFLALLARVGWLVWRPGPRPLIAMLAVGLNPLVLDYLSAARGYSFALMFWMASLERLLVASREPGSLAGENLPMLRRFAQFQALAVLSNLTFLLANVAIFVIWATWAWGIRRAQVVETARQTLGWYWRHSLRPGLVVFLCLGLPYIKLKPGDFYYGAATIRESLWSFVSISMAHHHQTFPWDNHALWYQQLMHMAAFKLLPIVLMLIVIFTMLQLKMLVPGFRPRLTDAPEPEWMLFVLTGGTVTLCLAMLAGMYAIGMKLPLDRTGIYMIPPVVLAILSSGTVWGDRYRLRRVWETVTLSVMVILTLLGAVQVQTNHYHVWRYDSQTRTAFQILLATHNPDSRVRRIISATKGIVPALNFYRDQYEADFLERFDSDRCMFAEADIYIIARLYGDRPPDRAYEVLWDDPVSGLLVVVPK